MKDTSRKLYRAKRRSVNEALDLLRSGQVQEVVTTKRKKGAKGEKANGECSEEAMISSHCCRTGRDARKRRVASSGFSRGTALLEMRKCLMRRDWTHLAELFPLLLEGRVDMEPLTWRYALTAFLCSPETNLASLNRFFGMCIGGQHFGRGHCLQRLIALQSGPD